MLIPSNNRSRVDSSKAIVCHTQIDEANMTYAEHPLITQKRTI